MNPSHFFYYHSMKSGSQKFLFLIKSNCTCFIGSVENKFYKLSNLKKTAFYDFIINHRKLFYFLYNLANISKFIFYQSRILSQVQVYDPYPSYALPFDFPHYQILWKSHSYQDKAHSLVSLALFFYGL